MSTWVWEYLDAPVSVKEVREDMGRIAEGYNPGMSLEGGLKAGADETQFRYALGPKVEVDCEAYIGMFHWIRVGGLIRFHSSNISRPFVVPGESI